MERLQDLPAGGPLSSYAADTYSQMGEDGVLSEILKRIQARATLSKWCVEVGAWDGVHLSNTARLIREDGFRGVLIEGDEQRAAGLRFAHPGQTVIAVHSFVRSEGSNRLDAILKTTPIPRDFDFLSIDIDGCDFYIWSSLAEYRPKVVAIEYNPTVPNEVVWVQPDDKSVNQGCSAAALVELGKRKGYHLVASTGVNLIFVASEYSSFVLKAGIPTLGEIRDDSGFRNFLFVGYDGSIHTSQDIVLPWHGNLGVSNGRVQALPRFLVGFFDNSSLSRRFRYRLSVLWANPKEFGNRLLIKTGLKDLPSDGGRSTS